MAVKKTLAKNGPRLRDKLKADRDRAKRVKRALRRQREHAIEPAKRRG